MLLSALVAFCALHRMVLLRGGLSRVTAEARERMLHCRDEYCLTAQTEPTFLLGADRRPPCSLLQHILHRPSTSPPLPPHTSRPLQPVSLTPSIFFYLMDPLGQFVDAFGKATTEKEVADKVRDALRKWEAAGGNKAAGLPEN